MRLEMIETHALSVSRIAHARVTIYFSIRKYSQPYTNKYTYPYIYIITHFTYTTPILLGREYASKFDYGQFITIRGFVKDSKCYLDSKGKPVDSRSDLLRLRTESRKILNIPEDAYVISNIGRP